jgi:hypothetical protein
LRIGQVAVPPPTEETEEADGGDGDGKSEGGLDGEKAVASSNTC